MNIVHSKIRFKNPLIPLDLNNVTAMIIHHIAAKVATPETINEWHIANGWSGIGYNVYIRKDGTIYICRGDFVGSHCQGQNSKSYGIAVEGDYDTELIMPQVQKDALINYINSIKAKFPNLIGVFPHSYFGNSNCPGKNFPMADVLKMTDKKKLEVDETFLNCLAILKEKGQINTPEYWMNNEKYDTEYVRNLIKSYGSYVYDKEGMAYVK